MRAGRIFAAIAWLGWVGATAAQDLGSEAQRAEGKQLYDQYCSQCHGLAGDGEGYATSRVKPQPRDLTSGKYKFRTTPSGMLPTDEDIARVIREGLPYTSMPGWPIFNEKQIQNLVYYVKTFSEDFADPAKYAEPIEIPEPPPITDESIARGRTVYEEQGCGACHGDLGRSDGLSAPTLKDDWGQHIRSADMTARWTFRGGATRKDIFRTFSTGLNGTPMPSYYDALAVEDRWDLVNYIVSLGDADEPNYSDLLVAVPLEEELDLTRGPELFADAPMSRFPLVGQIVEPGRNFYPSVESVMVQAVYNRSEIAFSVRWHDMRAEVTGANGPAMEVAAWDDEQSAAEDDSDGGGGDDFWGDEAVADEDDFWGDEAVADEDDFWGEAEDTGGGGAGGAAAYSDAVALQFPQTLPQGIRKPYFLFGDAQQAVDLWFVDLARARFVQQFTGRGSGSLDPASADEFEVASGYDKGEWFVIFKRELRSTSNVTFEQDAYVPIAFAVWDGFNEERGNKRALSSWFYVYVEPMEQVSPVGPMIKAAAVALVVELGLIFWIRRRFAAGTEPQRPAAGGAVPHGGMAK